MRLVLPLGIALLVGLAAIGLVVDVQTWAAVVIASGMVVAAAVAVVAAINRLLR